MNNFRTRLELIELDMKVNKERRRNISYLLNGYMIPNFVQVLGTKSETHYLEILEDIFSKLEVFLTVRDISHYMREFFETSLKCKLTEIQDIFLVMELDIQDFALMFYRFIMNLIQSERESLNYNEKEFLYYIGENMLIPFENTCFGGEYRAYNEDFIDDYIEMRNKEIEEEDNSINCTYYKVGGFLFK